LSISRFNFDISTKHYSGGEIQKICIAKALYANSKVLILDEPTKGMDSSSKSDIYNLMIDYVSKGNAILLLSSDFAEISGMADRTIIMKNGIIVKELKTDQNSIENIIYYSTVV
jgi:ABC-type sugar transport system ATPase subunit